MNNKFSAALCMLALLVAGCGKEQTVSTPAGDVKVTQKAGTTTFEMNDKGEKLNVTAAADGQSVALPAKFPSDIPIMAGAVVKLAIATGDNLSVQFSVAVSQPDAVKYYEDNLKAQGWTVDATVKMGESAMVAAKKGKRECAISVIKNGSGAVVQVVVPDQSS